MRAIGRGVVLTVLVGCVVLAGTSRGVAEVLDEQPIAAPEQQTGSVASPRATGESLGVRDVRIESDDTGRRVVLTLTRTPERVRDFALATPPRVVVDIQGPLSSGTRERRFPVTDPAVTRVRVAPYGGQLRVVLDLATRDAVREVRQDGATIIAELAPPVAKETKAAKTAHGPSDPVGQTEVPDVMLAAMVETAPAPAVEPTPIAAPTPAPSPEPAVVEPTPVATRAVDPTPRRPFRDIGDQGPTIEPMAAIDAYGTTRQPDRLAAARIAPTKDSFGPVPAEPTYTGTKISLDFKDADIQNVLRVLADVSGLNIIATDDVQGKVTLHLSDVPWDQAFDLILRTNRLERTQEANVVRVSSVKRLTEERDALKAANESEKDLEPLRVKYVRVNYARADESLVDKVKGVLTDRGAVTFDDRTNTVIIRDIDRGVDDASHLIRELDVQSPQVLIEANIVEATQDFARGIGVQWGYRYEGGPTTGSPTGLNFPGTVGIGGSGLGAGVPPVATGSGATPTAVPFLASFPVPSSFGTGFGAGSGSALDLALGSLDGAHSISTRLTALENEGKGKVISRPRVITMNNVAATIQSLTIIRVKLPSTGTVISTGAGGSAGGQSTATEKINTGITLVVTPQVSSDGFVLMNIYAKSSQPDFSRAVDGIPSEVSREANSNVLIRNGDTVVLGGIYRHVGSESEDGMPFLKDVPGLGWLFRRNLDSKHHEELLVFLTPKIMETGTVALPPAERLWSERRGG